jgi:hypothetical protein
VWLIQDFSNFNVHTNHLENHVERQIPIGQAGVGLKNLQSQQVSRGFMLWRITGGDDLWIPYSPSSPVTKIL